MKQPRYDYTTLSQKDKKDLVAHDLTEEEYNRRNEAITTKMVASGIPSISTRKKEILDFGIPENHTWHSYIDARLGLLDSDFGPIVAVYADELALKDSIVRFERLKKALNSPAPHNSAPAMFSAEPHAQPKGKTPCNPLNP